MTIKVDDEGGKLRGATAFETEELIKVKGPAVIIEPSLGKEKDKYEEKMARVYNPLEVKIADKKSVYMQVLMSVLANLTVLSSGMGLGYPAITTYALQREDDPMALSVEQASWFGKQRLHERLIVINN
jgi:hypothetical protein